MYRSNEVEQIIKSVYENIKRINLVDEFLENELECKGDAKNHLAEGYPGICIFLAELANFIEEPEILNFAHNYVIKTKENLEMFGYKGISTYTGLAGILMAVYSLSNNKTRYKALLNTLTYMILEAIKSQLKLIDESQIVKYTHYDCLRGFSGVAGILLNFKEDDGVKSVLNEILLYFVKIVKEIEYKGHSIPGYFIKDDIFIQEGKIINKETEVFDQGLSHGITGPLVIMALCLKEGIEVEGQRQAIQDILKFLKYFKYEDSDNIWWYGRVGLEQYINKVIKEEKNRASWCYGTPGIARAMYVAGQVIKDEQAVGIAVKALEGLCKMECEELGLKSVTICHGYSGVVMVLTEMYKDTGNPLYLKAVDALTEKILEQYEKNYYWAFKNYDINNPFTGDYTLGYKKDIGLVNGSIGVLLTLMETIKPGISNWKRIFLIS